MKVYLYKAYENYNRGEIIELNKETAESLIREGIARLATNRDYLVRPEFVNKVSCETKAFMKPPK